MSIYDKLLAYLIFGKHMVPFYGKKETYQFLRKRSIQYQKCVNLWQTMPTCDKSVQYARWPAKLLRILEYGHMRRQHVTGIYYVNPK